MRAESLHAALLIVVIAGLGLSLYAAYESLNPDSQSGCSIQGTPISCAKIDQSHHTTTFGVQDYDIGIAGFAVLLVLDIALYATWRPELLKAFVVVSGLGLAAALYLLYVEVAVIGGLCPVCFSTYVMDGAAFALSLQLWRMSDRADASDEAAESSPKNEPTASS